MMVERFAHSCCLQCSIVCGFFVCSLNWMNRGLKIMTIQVQYSQLKFSGGLFSLSSLISCQFSTIQCFNQGNDTFKKNH